MKTLFYSVAILAILLVTTSCNKLDSSNPDTSNIELRTKTLGFTDVAAYEASVAAQCAAGDHSNCDILSDSTHVACTHIAHSGTNHDGTNHNGMNHGTHDQNGGSHNGGNHNN